MTDHNQQEVLPLFLSMKGGVQSSSDPFDLHRVHLPLYSSHVWFLSVICALVALLTDLQTTHTGKTGSTLLVACFPPYKASAHSKQWQRHQLNCPHRKTGRLSPCWMGKANWVMGQKLILKGRPHVVNPNCKYLTHCWFVWFLKVILHNIMLLSILCSE